jgi:hypothetical protein
MLDLIEEVLKFLSPFVLVVGVYAVIYVIRRLQGKNQPGDWKPRAVPFKPGEITSSTSDSDDSDRIVLVGQFERRRLVRRRRRLGTLVRAASEKLAQITIGETEPWPLPL